MSKFHVQEGRGSTTGKKYFQVFLGGKAIGEPCTSREDAEAYISLLEQREAAALAEESEPPRRPSGPRM